MVTENIAGFIAETRDDQIPAEALAAAKKAFLDCLGVSLAGSRQPEADIISQLVKGFGGFPEAGIVGHGFKTSTYLAALANGVIAHALDFDDMSTKFLAHPSVNLVPAILALTESRGLAGKDVLTSYVIGYEVGATLGNVMGMKFFERGWHVTSVIGSVGAAASAARILRLDVPKARIALGIAASLANGLKMNFGTMTKPLHTGSAAHNGILAAMLADKGFTAHDSILEGPNGFCELYSGHDCDSGLIEEALGKTWYIVSPGIKFKLYPCCGSIFGCVDAILELKARHNILAEDVAEIECKVTPLATESGVRVHSPKTGQEGRFSLEYNMAMAIIDGELTLAQYTDEKVQSSQARELMDRVKITYPPDIGIGMEEPQEAVVTLRNGEKQSCRVEKHKGTIENPITDDELYQKFRDCASLRLNPRQVEEALELVRNIENLPDINSLTALVTLMR